MTLELIDVTARIGGRPVLDGVSLTLRSGELVAICGPNGAGKTSLLRAALGLLRVEAGAVRVGGAALATLSPRDRAAALAYLPQERRLAWNMPAVEVAALGAPFLSGDEALARARAGLEALDAGHLADRGVAEMSGGERARVALARALASDAARLLADEPVAGLDPEAQMLVLQRLADRARAGAGGLVTLHDLGLAARFADRVVVLANGRLAADASPTQALNPGILSSVFGLDARWVDGPDGPMLSARRRTPGRS